MKNLPKKVRSISHQHDLWSVDSKIILGISGGPDSICLLNIFLKLQKAYLLEFRIAHVNYGLRGKDSDADEKFVRALAKKHNLKITVFNAQPPKSAEADTFSLSRERGIRKIPSENELRNVRYDFFEKIRQENNFDLIAVAHNQDDQAETFLMRLLRGSGLNGLRAMKFKNGNVIRPLLATSRKEIMEYLKDSGLKYRTDRTNRTNLFLRNKVRNKLIPYLEKNFNPNIKKTLSDATLNIADDYSLLETITEENYIRHGNLSAKRLLALHPALQKRILLKTISAIKNDLKNIGSSHIEEMLKALRSTKGKNQVVLFQGLKMMRKGDKITISKL